MATRGRCFEVRIESGERFQCEVRQKVKTEVRSTTPVAVGDDVLLSIADSKQAAIEKVLPRRNSFARQAKGVEGKTQIIAANLDLLGIVVSVRSPELKTGLIDRFLVAAYAGNLKPFITFNKVDLEIPAGFEEITRCYQSLGYDVFSTSAVNDSGMEALKTHLAGHRTLFVGHSGVGKSSLLNKLVPGLTIRTQEISLRSKRGKHTTTSVELYELPSGGYLVDSPGLKVMGLGEIDSKELHYVYPDFEPFRGHCRFSPCTHIHEPGCAVKAALEQGKVYSFRYHNYLAIAESLS